MVRAVRAAAAREAGVLVTVTDVRGHAPREAGAKMVVSATSTWGSIGGGNLEEDAVAARGRWSRPARSRRRRYTVEPVRQGALPARRAVLRREVTCCSSRCPSCRPWHLRRRPRRPGAGADPGPPRPRPAPGRLAARRSCRRRELRCSRTRSPQVHIHHVPVMPELVLGELPPGTHVLVHDPRPRRGPRAVDAALRLRPPRRDRADRVVGQVGAVPRDARWRRSRPRSSTGSRRRSGCRA